MKTQNNIRKAGFIQAAIFALVLFAAALTGCQKADLVPGGTDQLSTERTSVNAVFAITHKGDVAKKLPIYSLQLFPDGKLTYKGIANVKTLGVVKLQFNDGTALQVEDILNAAGFAAMDDKYDFDEAGDACTTEARFVDLKKSVLDYGLNTPDALQNAKTTIEQMLKVHELAYGF